MQFIRRPSLSSRLVFLKRTARRAQSYAFTSIDPPGRDPEGNICVWGINDSGEIVGQCTATDGNTYGFLLSRGVYSRIQVPGSSFTGAHGINNAGQIVGEWAAAGETEVQGFLLSNGSYTRLRAPFNQPAGINSSGQIVGTAPSGLSGFILDRDLSTYTRLDGQGFGINDAGQVVGRRPDPKSEDPHGALGCGFLYFRGTYTDINIFEPGDAFAPLGINNAGAIVGNMENGDGPLVVTGDDLSFVDVPGVIEAAGINNLRQVVGTYTDASSSRCYGFVATPLPESPARGLLGFLGLLLHPTGPRR